MPTRLKSTKSILPDEKSSGLHFPHKRITSRHTMHTYGIFTYQHLRDGHAQAEANCVPAVSAVRRSNKLFCLAQAPFNAYVEKSLDLQRSLWRMKLFVSLRVVPHRREACAGSSGPSPLQPFCQNASVRALQLQALPASHTSCIAIANAVEGECAEVQLKRPRIAAGMRAKPPVCGLSDGDPGDKLAASTAEA